MQTKTQNANEIGRKNTNSNHRKLLINMQTKPNETKDCNQNKYIQFDTEIDFSHRGHRSLLATNKQHDNRVS